MVPPPDSDRVLPTASSDGHDDAAHRPRRPTNRSLKQPCRFDSPAWRVPVKKGKINKNKYNESGLDLSLCPQVSNLNDDIVHEVNDDCSSGIHSSIFPDDFNRSKVAVFIDGDRRSGETDEMALQHQPSDDNNASIPVVMTAQGESSELLKFKFFFLLCLI